MIGRGQEDRSILYSKEQVEWIRSLNLFSNIFMAAVMQDIPACQYVLRMMLGIPDLEVSTVYCSDADSPQAPESSELDVLAEDHAGKHYLIGVQQADDSGYPGFVQEYWPRLQNRFFSTEPDLQKRDVYLIYISETDCWQFGLSAYPMQRCFQSPDAGEKEVRVLYANAAVNDGSERARMLQYFREADPEDDSQGDLSARVRYLKEEQGGYREIHDAIHHARKFASHGN